MKCFRTLTNSCWPLVCVLFMVMLALSFGCGKKEADRIKIGAIIPLTGESAFWGVNIKNGVDLAVEEINASGGILGKQFEIIYEDSRSKPSLGTQAANKLITVDKVQCIIGDVISSVILAVAPIVERNKVVLLGFGESAEITHAGDYIFRNWNSAASDAIITSRYAAEHSKKLAVLSQNDAFGMSAKSLFVSEIKKRGVEIAIEEQFAPDERDFKSIITKMQSTDYDAIYFGGFHAAALIFLRQYKEMGMPTVNLYGVSSLEEGTLIEFVQSNYPNRLFYGYPMPPDTTAPEVRRFISSYTARYGKAPEILCDNGYDAVYMLKYGIERAGVYNGEKIKEALYTLKDFNGASGVMSFDRNGDIDKPFGLKVIGRDGAVWIHNKQ